MCILRGPQFFSPNVDNVFFFLGLYLYNDGIPNLRHLIVTHTTMQVSYSGLFAVLLEPHSNVQETFEIRLWSVDAMNIMGKYNYFMFDSFLP